MARTKGKDSPGWLKPDYKGFSLTGVSRKTETVEFSQDGKDMSCEYSPVSFPNDISVVSAFFGENGVTDLIRFVESTINARLKTQAIAATREAAEPSFDAFLDRAIAARVKIWQENPKNAGRSLDDPAKNGKGTVREALKLAAEPEARQKYEVALARFNAKRGEDEI